VFWGFQLAAPFLSLFNPSSQTGIGCPWDDFEANNAIAFGYLVAWFIGEVGSQKFLLSLSY